MLYRSWKAWGFEFISTSSLSVHPVCGCCWWCQHYKRPGGGIWHRGGVCDVNAFMKTNSSFSVFCAANHQRRQTLAWTSRVKRNKSRSRLVSSGDVETLHNRFKAWKKPQKNLFEFQPLVSAAAKGSKRPWGRSQCFISLFDGCFMFVLDRADVCLATAAQLICVCVCVQLSCGHRCKQVCHPGVCEETCQQKVKLRCPCKRIRKVKPESLWPLY